VELDHLYCAELGARVSHVAWHGRVTLRFENKAVYQDAGDTVRAGGVLDRCDGPGVVPYYVDSGPNVLGPIIRDQIKRRGLPTTRCCTNC
jgi:hypothetical protein